MSPRIIIIIMRLATFNSELKWQLSKNVQQCNVLSVKNAIILQARMSSVKSFLR